MTHIRNHLAESGGIPRHLETDIETFLQSKLFLYLCNRRIGGIDSEGGTHLSREFETIWIEGR
jgi:hypothetical protein